jgi:type I restriction enzyme S subunit
LGDLFKTAAGGTPPTTKREYYDGGTIPWILSGEVRQGVISSAKSFITVSGLKNSSAKVFPKGTVLVALYGATAGQVGILDIEAATNQAVFGIYPNDNFSPKFIFYLLRSRYDDLVSQAVGNAQPNLSGLKIKNVLVPSIALPDQRRIVGILDEAFAGIATAKANAEKNLQNARALFESDLQTVFAQRGDGWVEKRISDVVERLTNGYVGPTRNIYHDTGIPYLLARHVRDNRLTFDGKTYISAKFNQKHKKSMLKAGDVLLVQSGHIGHSAVVPAIHEGHNCHAMIVITPVKNRVSGEFLSLSFNSPVMQDKFARIRSGSTVPHLTCRAVRELLVPVPSLATQAQLVDSIHCLASHTQRLESIYRRKLAALDELKESLLHQAFSGQL